MTKNPAEWTNNIEASSLGQHDIILERLCQAFNSSPFFVHNFISMRVNEGQIEGFVDMQPHLIGNIAYGILHGGVTATMLDSIGGIVAMAEMYRRATLEDFNDALTKTSRLATLDLRVDYIAPGRGKFFITHAEVLRLGRKSCTMRMHLYNDENTLIATAIGSYSF